MTENYTYEAARGILLSALPEAPAGKRTAAEEDAYVKGALAIAEYVIDRWTLEASVVAGHTVVTPHLKKKVKGRLDDCSDRHFASLSVEAAEKLDRYVKRRTHVMVASDVAEGADAFRKNVVRSAIRGTGKFQRRIKSLEEAIEKLESTVKVSHPNPTPGKVALKWVGWALITLAAGPLGVVGVIWARNGSEKFAEILAPFADGGRDSLKKRTVVKPVDPPPAVTVPLSPPTQSSK